MNAKPQRYAVVGMKNYPGAAELLAVAANDHPVMLVREPTNRFDPNAVQVWMKDADAGWRHVGYVPKTQNAVLSQFIDREGKAWVAPHPVMALDSPVAPNSVEVLRAVDARLHMGNNTYPLVEVV